MLQLYAKSQEAWRDQDARYGTHVVELNCINFGESATFVGGKVFERPALAALTCPVHS